jgi:hypothetical protein
MEDDDHFEDELDQENQIISKKETAAQKM